ncbi:MAG: hypothetical protein QME48_05830 [bacterium]|nr:hypothetical protein [bacterium]
MVGELGRWEYGPTEAIAVKGNTAYISSGSYLWVMDISNESNPRLISEMKLENYIHYIRRIGNYLYVSKNDTLLNIYDIHTDTVPMLVNQIEGTNSEYPWYDVYVDGDTVYISGYDNKQYFINDTVNLQYIRRIGFDYQVAVEETVLVATDDNIVVYDLKQTGNINSATDLYLTSEKTRGLELKIPFIYFGYGSKGIGIMDISNLYDIKLKKTVATGGNTYDVEIIEDTILIAAKGLNGIGIYDVEGDTILTEIGVCETNGYTYELEVIGNRLYVGARSGGLIIVDITDKSNPMVVGEYRGYGESRRMAIEGDRMYVASGDGGVMIMDITDRENPEVISQCWTRDIGEDVVKGGDYLYVADGDSGLTVVDISDEYNPSVVGNSQITYYCSQIGVFENTCAVGGWSTEISNDTINNGIKIVDITTSSNPVNMGSINRGHKDMQFELVDTFVHVISNEGVTPRYAIWDISNTSIPMLRDSIMGSFGFMNCLTIENDTVIMEYGSASIDIYSVTNKDNILKVDSMTKSDWSKLMRKYGSYLLEVNYTGDLTMWNISDIHNPDTVMTTEIIKTVMDIEKTNEHIYTTHNQYGISVYGFDMVPPSKITLIEPQDGDTAYNNSMEVTWHKSTDTGVGIDRYEVYVNGIEEGETTDTSMVVNTTSTGTRNVWVKVYDRVGNSSYSDTNAVYLLTGIEGKDETRVTDKELTIKTTLNRISVYNGTTEKQEIEVLDIMGRVVEKRELKQKEKYELSPKSGIYFIRSGKNKTSKIAVIK